MTKFSLAQFDGTMGSRELAELTQTRHDSVKRTIETLVHKKAMTLPQIEEASFLDSLSKRQTVNEYRLSHRDTMVVAARLNPQFMARVVDRWMELEVKLASAVPAQVAQLQSRIAELEAYKQAQDLALLQANPRWETIVLLRAAGKDGAFIAKALGCTRSGQEREVRRIRAAGLAHLLPVTARPAVGRKLASASTAQMSLEV